MPPPSEPKENRLAPDGAERNGRLLLASLAGVKAGAAQIQQIQAARDHLRTYAPSGARVEVTPPPGSRDQRA